jgi:outer membrane receptor protein involved in Fe transport
MFELRQSWKLTAALILLLVLGAVQAFAQLDSGSIVGIARDKSGAVVADATVKATNTKTGKVYETKTTGAGEYTVTGLPSGPYKIEVDRTGFKTGVVTDIFLHATERRSADVTLDVGATSEQVTVAAQAIAVNTQSSDTGAIISSNSITNLPLNGRDFTALIALVPGAVTTGQFGQNSLSGFETGFAGVNVLLDGADATRIDTNATSTQLGRQQSRISRASIDSIQEFRVMQSTYSAEFGRSVGDVVNVVTKSGGNQFHGNLFEYFRNNALDAKNYFSTGNEPLHMNQFGGNLSGPLVKNKLFFFMNYEGVRQNISTPVQAQVLSQYYRTLAVPSIQPVIDAIPVGNGGPVMIDTNNDGVPDTILTDGGGHVVREYYNSSLLNTLSENTGSVKVDWNASQKDTFSFRFNVNQSDTSTQYGVAEGQTAPSFSTNYLLKGSWNHTFSPNVLNEFGVAWNRPQTNSLGGGGQFDTIFQCFFCNDLDAYLTGNSPFTLGTTPGPALFSSRRPQHSYQFIDNVSWVKGRQSFKFGADIRKAHTQDQLDPQRFMTFYGPDAFGLFGLLPNFAFQISTLGYNQIDLGNWNYGFYFQDDIRVTPRFTLNLGVRYDINSVLKSSQLANFSVSTGTVLPTGSQLYQPDYNNIGPRVGFSWDPYGKGETVIRGGFGIFYSPLLTGAALSLANNNQPGYNVNLFSTNCPALTWSWPLPATLPNCPALPYSVNALDQNMRDTYSEHWSFGIQQQLFADTVLEVSYVGNHGVKLPAGAAGAGLELNLNPWDGTPYPAPQGNPAYANIRRLGNFLGSRYDALQASVRRRVAKGLNLDANYTWAHELDNAVNIFSAFQNSFDPGADWSSGDIDVRHNFTLGLVYDLPGSLKAKGFANGWQVSTLMTARTGLPVNVTVAAPFLGLDLIRPNFTGAPVYTNNHAPNTQFNVAAFSDPGAGNYGDVPRNFLRGPGFKQVDLALTKTTKLKENLDMLFRVEAFNLFNHPNFANPDGIWSDTNFGKSMSTVGNQVGTGTSRQLQLVMKFTF